MALGRPVNSRGNAMKKKEEFPGPMENMRPENSFPQICVVSVNQFVEIEVVMQEHGGSVNESNRDYLLTNTGTHAGDPWASFLQACKRRNSMQGLLFQ